MRLLGNILRLNDLAPEHLAVFNPRKADTPLHQSLTVRTLPKDVSKKQRGGPHTWFTWYWQSIKALNPNVTLDLLEEMARDRREWNSLTERVCAHIDSS